MKAVSYVRKDSLDSHQIVRFPYQFKSPQSVTAWVAAIRDKAKFRVCVGVRSGPKGRVIDISICGVPPDKFANDYKVVGYIRRGSLDSHQIMHFPYEIA